MSLVAPEVKRDGFYYVPSLDSSFPLEGIQDGKAKENYKGDSISRVSYIPRVQLSPPMLVSASLNF